jgi:hypothetical protein
MHAEFVALLYPLFQFYLPNFPLEVRVVFLGLARAASGQLRCPAELARGGLLFFFFCILRARVQGYFCVDVWCALPASLPRVSPPLLAWEVKTANISTSGPGATADTFPQNTTVGMCAGVGADTVTLIRSNSPLAPQDQTPASMRRLFRRVHVGVHGREAPPAPELARPDAASRRGGLHRRHGAKRRLAPPQSGCWKLA